MNVRREFLLEVNKVDLNLTTLKFVHQRVSLFNASNVWSWQMHIAWITFRNKPSSYIGLHEATVFCIQFWKSHDYHWWWWQWVCCNFIRSLLGRSRFALHILPRSAVIRPEENALKRTNAQANGNAFHGDHDGRSISHRWEVACEDDEAFCKTGRWRNTTAPWA